MLITPDGRMTIESGNLTVKKAQAILGGDFEVLPVPADLDITMLAYTDAKRDGQNANWGATAVIRGRLRPDDFVAGTVIVTGGPDKAGDLTSLSVKAEEAIRRKVAK
jgi:hypothetical protein